MAAGPASAELVATGFRQINRTDMLIIEMSDQQRPEVGDSPCADFGQFMALLSVGSASTMPRTLPYAAGCWAYSNGVVYVTAETLRERKPFSLQLQLSDIDTAKAFKGWDKYRPRRR